MNRRTRRARRVPVFVTAVVLVALFNCGAWWEIWKRKPQNPPASSAGSSNPSFTDQAEEALIQQSLHMPPQELMELKRVRPDIYRKVISRRLQEVERRRRSMDRMSRTSHTNIVVDRTQQMMRREQQVRDMQKTDQQMRQLNRFASEQRRQRQMQQTHREIQRANRSADLNP